MECLLYALANLLCQSFLHLQPMAVDVNDAGNLAQSRDVTVGNIGHMCLPIERYHVVFAEREEINVLHDHHLVVFLCKQRIGEHLVGVLRIAAG